MTAERHILGDLLFRNEKPAEEYLKQLKGKKHLIIGNHDRDWVKKCNLEDFFESVNNLHFISDGKRQMTLCHYPMMSWPHMTRCYMVFGHIHGNTDADYWPLIRENDLMLNAGADVNKPLIWRRFQVAGNITLAQLGYVTMTLFEMKGSHLFHLEYSVNENMPDDDPAYQSEPDKILRYDIAGGDSFPETMISNTYAATEMTLRRFTSRGDATFHFFYDYGDGWEVVLRLEEVFEDSELPGKELPRVLEGQGFGIIEDCGGPAGLEHLREVFQQKSSPEYQSMREWLGTSEVDLSVFDLQDLNFRLKKLPRIFRDLYEYDYPPTKHSIDLLDRKYCKTN